jgi:hypothetical protein
MNKILLLSILFFHSVSGIKAQDSKLQGVVNVWNNNATTVSLIDDYYYALSPGDELIITVGGLENMANIAPRDEQRKGGGFLGLFKKSYNVRIDDWKTADQVKLAARVADFNVIDFTPVPADRNQTARFKIPFDNAQLENELLKNFKLNAWIHQFMSPLRAGHYNVSVQVNSNERLQKLKAYFESPDHAPQMAALLTFENDIKKFVENGKLIYRHPEETVAVIEVALANKPNVDGIKKDLYKYLLQFAPGNTSVRAGLAEVYLKELNFSEAQVEAQNTINLLSKKDAGTLTNKELIDFGRSYEVIASVNELKELGLQENAYSVGAIFFGEAAKWYQKAETMDEYTKVVMKQVRCLQKVGDLNALKQAASILNEFDSEIKR